MESAKANKYCSPPSITSGMIHLWGFLLAMLGTAVLIVFSALHGTDPWKLVSFSVYGSGLIFLYGASAAYHIFYVSERVHRRLRKLDHCMIFYLIFATYTPLCLVTMRDTVGWIYLGVVWTMMVVGIILKIKWIDMPKLLSSLLYLMMGWALVAGWSPLAERLPAGGRFWLLVGGAFYTVGALLYALKPLHFEFRCFGSHELFHILILIGSACHYVLIFRYVMM